MKRYICVPECLFYQDVSMSAKVLYCNLIGESERKQSNDISITNSDLAIYTGVSVATTSRLLSQLNKKGLITMFNVDTVDEYGDIIGWRRIIRLNARAFNYEK